MGARRIAAKKNKPRVSLPNWQSPGWLTRRLLGGAILLSAVSGVLGFSTWHLLQTDTLPIESVQVKGANSGFFSVDVHAVKQAAESLAWVDRASVRRVWPNVLQVEIIEQVPLAKWGKSRVVNRRGEIIDVDDGGQLSALPVFSGPEGSSVMLAKRFQLMSTQLAEIGLGVTALKLNERRAWQVLLNNGLYLLLGRSANESQLARFSEAYKTVLAEQTEKIQSVDLRYTNGFAVRWKTVS